jgi:hypothetical protein
MNDGYWPAFFGFLTVICVSIIGHVANYLNTKKTKEDIALVKTEVATVAAKVEQVHLATNSLTDRLIQTTGEAEKAKGVIEGKAEEKAKQKTYEG